MTFDTISVDDLLVPLWLNNSHHMHLSEQKDLIVRFIDEIWNNGNTNNLDTFLHPAYKDYSLPAGLPVDATGLKQWVAMVHESFQPQTVIEEHLAEPGHCMVRISMQMKHTGLWRGIPATGQTAVTSGFRSFAFKDGRIIEHRALMDGNTLEQQLRAAADITGCQPKTTGNG
ncbi:ester cyclase [Chitinophaga sp. G-6-1-13]|uniref:Ester cyclase n=1 Tax=Chitinophaga fulva TaxID=2728842 RepID=A0A848GEX1_9BACT|nr:ester cyclase [Chitinophaga fulva]NML36606.1 ester cyclase [Chitinophaga fulva]